MRSLLLLCLLAVTLASEEFDYEPDPEVGRVRRSYIVREYEYYDEEDENDVAPEVIHEDVVEPLPTDEQCKGHCNFYQPKGRRYTRERSTENFNKDHYVDKGGKGEKVEEVHKKQYEEAGGKKKKHHDHAGHQGNHEEEAHGHRGAKFDEKKGHKKGHKTKGYHNKYHKDEFHKEHKFYDDYHKSGEHHRFGKFNAKHASNESGKKKAHHVDAGHDYVEKGRKGYSNKGHVDADHKGYTGKRGHDEHHKHESSRGKKGGKEGGSQWAHAKKH